MNLSILMFDLSSPPEPTCNAWTTILGLFVVIRRHDPIIFSRSVNSRSIHLRSRVQRPKGYIVLFPLLFQRGFAFLSLDCICLPLRVNAMGRRCILEGKGKPAWCA
ncbi:hypothetical protein BJV74DRAFT_548601 [Russula compacta]|nr:hypothetical protein BJV74DRAFT_548601 [Russula compacta]